MSEALTAHVPPQNIEAEEAVLGAMMVSESGLRAVRVAGLRAAHFYLDKHREIYAALERVVQRQGYVDQLMLADEAPAHKDYIAALTAKVPAAGNAKHYAEIVLRHANLRQKLEGAQGIMAGVRTAQDGGDEAEAEAEELIRQGQALVALDLTVEAEPTSREELAHDFYEHLDSNDDEELFELPFADLNECVLGGYRRKQTSVLAGWTGMGKSWLLDQMLRGFHQQGHSTAIFATEMSRRERIARHVTQETGIATEKLLRPKLLSDHERAKAVKALGHIPFDYFEVSGWSVGEICERIIFGGYDIVAVDVVNLLPRYEEKVAYANAIAQQLMEVAVRANCHVIVVSHLNRERDKYEVKPKPVPRDLRQTGMLEANAHAILFIHRDQDSKGAKEPGAEIFLAKTRNGMEGDVRATFNQRYLTFQPEAAREPLPAPGEHLADPDADEPTGPWF